MSAVISRVRKFFISMLNRGFMHGGRCLFDGTYFGIELHTQKLYECEFKLIFYCKMSRLVPRKNRENICQLRNHAVYLANGGY